MKKLVILYSIGSLRNNAGGVERVLSTKTKFFTEKLNYDIHIATNDSEHKAAYNFSDKIKIHNLGSPRDPRGAHNAIGRLISNWKIKKDLYKRYRDLITSIRPDVVIVLERGTDDFYLPKICKQLGIPVCREFHFAKNAVYERANLMTKWVRFKYLFTYRRIFHAFNNYDYLVLLTQKDQREGGYKTNTIVIPNVVELESDEKMPNYDSKNVISIGSMHDNRKGFDTIIKIWSKVVKQYPEWTLHICGDGSEKTNLIQLTKNLGITKNVIFHGNVANILDYYLNSSFYISAAVAEGLPMVLIEAMNAGLPCVAYDCPTGPSDIISDGESGILVPLGDTEKLESAIFKYIENPDLVHAHGENAKIEIRKFAPERIIPLWDEFFKSLIHNE